MDKDRSGELTVACIDWRPRHKGTLCGFASIHLVEFDVTIHDVSVHRTGGVMWAALPSPLEFDSREMREAFSHAALAAVVRCPSRSRPGPDEARRCATLRLGLSSPSSIT